MSALSKILPIYLSLIVANTVFNFLNITIWLSKIKSGVYTLPLDKIPIVNLIFNTAPVFQSWWKFTIAAWCFNVIGYIPATLIVAWAYKTSVDRYSVLYTAFVVNQIISIAIPMLFLYLQIGELPNKQEWFGLTLIFIASLIFANSR